MKNVIIKTMNCLYAEGKYDELYKLLEQYPYDLNGTLRYYYAECLKHDGYDNYDLFEIYELAADEGCVPAMYVIADYYYHEYFDYTEEEDLEKFMKYAKMGAENGNTNSQYLYGIELVKRHEEDSVDFKIGLDYIKKAAIKGHKESIEFLEDFE